MNDWFAKIVSAAPSHLLLSTTTTTTSPHAPLPLPADACGRVPWLPNKRDNCSVFAGRHIKQCVLTAWQAVIHAKLMAFSIPLARSIRRPERGVVFSINEEKNIFFFKLNSRETSWAAGLESGLGCCACANKLLVIRFTPYCVVDGNLRLH